MTGLFQQKFNICWSRISLKYCQYVWWDLLWHVFNTETRFIWVTAIVCLKIEIATDNIIRWLTELCSHPCHVVEWINGLCHGSRFVGSCVYWVDSVVCQIDNCCWIHPVDWYNEGMWSMQGCWLPILKISCLKLGLSVMATEYDLFSFKRIKKTTDYLLVRLKGL